MRIPLIQVDAFTSRPFGGNPAAVCPLDSWLADELLQAIALENNLSETAFFVPEGPDGADYHLRWFTPTTEVDLCGHATLAAAHVIFEHLGHATEAVSFDTQSGQMRVGRHPDGRLELDFPAQPPMEAVAPNGLAKELGAKPEKVMKSPRDGWWLIIYPDEATVAGLKPDFGKLAKRGKNAFIVTAPGEDCDFVSRCFVPGYGIDEDPVTGSAHCISGPYWHNRLGKDRLFARQISPRRGELWLTTAGDRELIAGHAVEVITGEMVVPEE